MAERRPERVGHLVQSELARLLIREAKDPRLRLVTVTSVKMTPDLQNARVYYTTLGDAEARKQTARALGRATPFLRRQLGSRLRLRRIPELQFFYDENIERLDRVERILQELESERAGRATVEDLTPATNHDEQDDDR